MGKPSVRHPVCVLRCVFYIHRCHNNNNDNIVHVTRRFPVTSNDTSEGRLFPRVAAPQPPPPLLYARFRKRCNNIHGAVCVAAKKTHRCTVAAVVAVVRSDAPAADTFRSRWYWIQRIQSVHTRVTAKTAPRTHVM